MMAKISLALLVLLNAIAPPRAAVLSTDAVAKCIPEDQCCKVCSEGRACGNSCIHATYTCHKGHGCACNEEDICK
jgi:hypothetical protein